MSNSKKGNITSVKDTNKMIIMAIDSLKGRKARPDEVRICNFVERKFNMKKSDTLRAINEAVANGTILKVKTMTRSNDSGASVTDVTQSLHSKCQLLNYDQEHINAALQTALKIGSVQQLPDGNYILTCGKRIVPRKTDPDHKTGVHRKTDTDHKTGVHRKTDTDHKASTSKVTSHNESLLERKDKTIKGIISNKDDNLDNGSVENKLKSNVHSSSSVKRKKTTQVVKRARPFSKRKKIKKSLGPDFLEPSELGLQYLQDTYEPKCDKCNSSTSSNPEAEHEELLVCKDCSFKAHPSCMKYCKELADRSRRSPWQCMDCKTCSLCDDSGDGDCMLVCDMCDKGYHMNCLNPALKEKPNGTWVCSDCKDESSTDETSNEDTFNNQFVNETKNKKIKSEIEPENNSLIQEPVIKKTPRLVIKEEISKEDMSKEDMSKEDMSKEDMSKESSDSVKSASPTSTENNLNITNPMFDGYPDIVRNPHSWTIDDVEMFIRFIGFPEQSHLFKEQEIDGSTLLLMRRNDILTGFEMKLGPALKIYSHILRLQKCDY